jgi:hypothetical protein
MKNQNKLYINYLAIIFALILTTISTAHAATFMVNVDTDLHDSTPGDGKCVATSRTCTLRAAIEEANALPGDDEIVFSDSFQAPNQPRTIYLTLNQLQIQDALVINGPGARQLMIDGNHTSRVLFTSAPKKNIFISKLTVQNGYAYAANSFLTYAAGIWHASGFLKLEDVTVRNNDTTGADPKEGEAGGGISNSGSMQIIRSTVSGNKAGYGGGIYNGGTLVVYNSTISDNASQYGGGGIMNLNYALVENTTIAGNTSQTSGGGFWSHKDVESYFDNTIIADNNAPSNPDVEGKFVSYGNNLVENRGTSSGYVASDLPNGTVPLLGILQNNGGATDTRALLAGSQAIDAGSNCPYINATVCLSAGGTDQRGFGYPRKIGSSVDIGAFELKSRSNVLSVQIGGRVLKPNGSGLNKALVTLTDESGVTRTVETDSGGHYIFDDVATGKSYIIKAESRHYEYASQTLFVDDSADNVNFVPAGR